MYLCAFSWTATVLCFKKKNTIMRYCRKILSSSWRCRRVKLLTVKFVTPLLCRCRTLKFLSFFFTQLPLAQMVKFSISVYVSFLQHKQIKKKKKHCLCFCLWRHFLFQEENKAHFLPNDLKYCQPADVSFYLVSLCRPSSPYLWHRRWPPTTTTL